MKRSQQLVLRISIIIAVAIIALCVAAAVYYFVKPVDPNGPACTFDNYGCESNSNIFAGMGYLVLAAIVAAVYVVFRLALAWWARHRS